MWIKLAGAAALVTGCGMIGLSRAGRLSQRVAMLEKLSVAAAEIGSRIALGQECLDELLHRALPPGLDWAQGQLSFDRQFPLCEDERELVAEWLDGLGFCDAATDRGRCETYAQLFRQRLETARTERDEKQKLYEIGGFAIGLAVSMLCL